MTESLRDRCLAWLEEHVGPGGPLAVGSSAVRMPDRDEWERMQSRVAVSFRARQTDVNHDGRVVVTAGPPGVGKSSAIRRHDTAGFRRIDPDDIKDMLLRELDAAGYLKERFDYQLPDGSPVMLRELSGWVHQASVDIADKIRVLGLADGENLVVEGALGWREITRQYPQECKRWGCSEMSIIDVEAPLSTVLDQARQRWWDGREDDMGGRYVPAAVIAGMYSQDGTTTCNVNASLMLAQARALGMSTQLDLYRRNKRGGMDHTQVRAERSEDRSEASIFIARVDAGDGSAAVDTAGRGGRPRCLVCGRPLRSAGSIARGAGPGCAVKLRDTALPGP